MRLELTRGSVSFQLIKLASQGLLGFPTDLCRWVTECDLRAGCYAVKIPLPTLSENTEAFPVNRVESLLSNDSLLSHTGTEETSAASVCEQRSHFPMMAKSLLATPTAGTKDEINQSHPAGSHRPETGVETLWAGVQTLSFQLHRHYCPG